MPINPAIALGVKGIELQDPLAQYGKVMAIQGAQNQNALAQYQLGAAQRAEAKDIARTNALAQAGTDDTAIANALLKSGDLKGYSDFLKTRRETMKADTELVDTKLKQSRAFLENINPNDPNAPQQYLAWHQANHADPVLGSVLKARGITAEQSLGRINDAISKGPQAFAQLLAESKLGTDRFMELNKPQLSTTDLGGQVVSRTFAPITGELKTIGTEKKTMAPGEADRIGISRQQLALDAQRIKNEGQRIGLEGRRVAVLEDRTKDTGVPGVQLSKKELQARESAFPKATTAVKGFEADADELVSDLERLKNHPGLSNITGVIAGRTPSLTAQGRAAQALYDKIIAKGGFQSLQDIRNASPTGGALGPISNQEGQQLKAAFSEIDQKMDAPDVRGAIDRTIQKVRGSKERVREGYDLTYEYRAPSETMPAAPKPGKSNLAPQDQAALDWANANPSDPRAAEIKATLGVK